MITLCRAVNAFGLENGLHYVYSNASSLGGHPSSTNVFVKVSMLSRKCVGDFPLWIAIITSQIRPPTWIVQPPITNPCKHNNRAANVVAATFEHTYIIALCRVLNALWLDNGLHYLYCKVLSLGEYLSSAKRIGHLFGKCKHVKLHLRWRPCLRTAVVSVRIYVLWRKLCQCILRPFKCILQQPTNTHNIYLFMQMRVHYTKESVIQLRVPCTKQLLMWRNVHYTIEFCI